MWEDGRGAPRAGLEWHEGPQETGYSVASFSYANDWHHVR